MLTAALEVPADDSLGLFRAALQVHTLCLVSLKHVCKVGYRDGKKEEILFGSNKAKDIVFKRSRTNNVSLTSI